MKIESAVKIMKSSKCLLRIASLLLTLAVGVAVVRMFSVDLTPLINEKNNPLKSKTRDFSISDQSYEVFSSVISDLEDSEQIVVSDYTSPTPLEATKILVNPLRRNFTPSEEIIRDYQANNIDAHKLENKFTAPGEVFLLSRQEEDVLFPKGGAGWDKFHERFPKAGKIFYFSGVGFNPAKTEALIYVGHNCASCSGNYYLLKKVEGSWKVWARFWRS